MIRVKRDLRAAVAAVGVLAAGRLLSCHGGLRQLVRPGSTSLALAHHSPRLTGHEIRRPFASGTRRQATPGHGSTIHGDEFAFLDIGANLLDPMFQGLYRGKMKHPADLDAVLDRAGEAGVRRIIVTAGSLSETSAALELCHHREQVAYAKSPRLFCTVGVHPTRCLEFEEHTDGPKAYMQSLRKLALDSLQTGEDSKASSLVAVGEFGLDYDRLEFCSKQTQLIYFERQLQELAKPLALPMFLHCRGEGAAADLVEVLSRNSDCLLPTRPGVVHSFDGTVEEAKMFIGLGFHIGINGCSLKTARNLEVVRQLPLDRIHLETDAPWCGIRPSHAGAQFVSTRFPEVRKPDKWQQGSCVKGRCEPCHIVQVLEAVAGARGLGHDSSQLRAAAETCFGAAMGVFFPGESE